MPRDGSGTYTKPVNSVDPAVPATTISSNDFNQLTNDLTAEMTDSLDRSGKGAMLAALAMGANKITNLGVPSVASDAARLDTVTGIALAGDVTGPTGTTVVANVPGGKVTGLALGAFAPAGKVGELVNSGNVVAVSSTVVANITSVALTAGNWLLFAEVNTGPTGATTSYCNACISTASAVMTGVVGNALFQATGNATVGFALDGTVGIAAVSITIPTTYYLNGSVGFAGGSMTLGGAFTAIRLG